MLLTEARAERATRAGFMRSMLIRVSEMTRTWFPSGTFVSDSALCDRSAPYDLCYLLLSLSAGYSRKEYV